MRNIICMVCKKQKPYYARNLCKSCYEKEKKIDINIYPLLVKNPEDEDKYISDFCWRNVIPIVEETYEEWFTRTYDEELKKEIEYFKKTGKILN